MQLRQTKPADYATALRWISPAYAYPSALRAALPKLWSAMQRAGQLGTGAVEDPSLPAESRPRGLGLSTFVEEDFADEALAHPRPGLNARLMELVAAGRSPLLDRRRIAAKNAGEGLTLLQLHFATPSFDTSQPSVMRTLAAGQELLRLVHGGYRIRRMFKEVIGTQVADFMQASGMPLHTAFPAPGLSDAERPFLLAATRADLPLGSAMSLWFIPDRPRFGFSSAEQRVLFSALMHESETAVAEELCLSLDTLRKHWRAIYAKVSAVDPDFFPEATGAEGRGPGKRRRLLRHVSEHLEELRPWQDGPERSHARSTPVPADGEAARL